MKRLAWYLPLLTLCGAVIIWLYLTVDGAESDILWQIRLPRLILTLYTGMVLAGIGSVYQMMLSNPLAEPYILGISSGAALGAVIAVVLGLFILMPLLGFGGAIITMIIVWAMAQRNGFFDKTRLLLSGIIAGMFFGACISLLMYLNHKDTLVILGTLMGNTGYIFTGMEYRYFLALAGVSTVLLGVMYRDSLILDIMTTGDIYAGSVGINVQSVRRRLFVISSLLTGITVAYAGIIGFVGLMIPHIVRLVAGTRQRIIFPLSVISGGIFLLMCDFLAQHLTVLELPVGVITAFVGCPFFAFLLLHKSK